MPKIPAFAAGVGYFFNIVALDWAALFAFASDPQLREQVTLYMQIALYAASTILFILFLSLWCAQSSAPDQLADGDEVASYKEKNGKVRKSVKFKIYILKACHTLYQPVCKLVFVSWYLYLFTPLQLDPTMTPGRSFFYLSFLIFLGFVLGVPYVTMRYAHVCSLYAPVHTMCVRVLSIDTHHEVWMHSSGSLLSTSHAAAPRMLNTPSTRRAIAS